MINGYSMEIFQSVFAMCGDQVWKYDLMFCGHFCPLGRGFNGK